MSALKLQLLFATCVLMLLRGIIGLHHFRYPVEDSKWRPHTRQDIFAPSRYFLWNYNLPPAYTSPKNPVVPASFSMNYNRYGLPPMPSMLHHPNYLIAMQNSQLNNYGYRTTKDLNTKSSKPGNFPHITIFNAIIPKPFIPLSTVPLQLGQQSLRSPRNNKPLAFYNNKGRQVGNAKQNLAPPPHFRLVKQNDNSFRNTTGVGHPLVNKFHLPVRVEANNDNNNGGGNSSRCGQKAYEGHAQVDINASSYYCNSLSTYESVTKKRQIQQKHPVPTATLATIQPDKGEVLHWPNVDVPTSPKPIFLPTIYEPRHNSIVETTTSSNNKARDTTSTTTTTAQSFNREVPHRQSFFNLEEPRHPIYASRLNYVTETTTTTNDRKKDKTSSIAATVPSFNREVAHTHGFFTLEDAITRAPTSRNYIFNDPYEALSHARKRKELQSKQTSTKEPRASSEKNSLFLNFFDDNTETPFNMMHFNRSRFVDSPPTYFSYMNNAINTNWDSVFKSHIPYAQSIEPNNHYSHVLNATPYFNTQPTTDIYAEKTTSTHRPISHGMISTTKAPTFTDIEETTLTPTSTTEHFYKTTQFINEEKPIVTTAASTSTAPSITVKTTTTRWKHPFYGRSPPTFKMRNNSSAILAALKNSTQTSTTSVSSKKKAHKYQRRYKPKKNKLFKSLILTTLGTTVSVVKPTPSTTIETTTKEISNRTAPAQRTVTTRSTTEASTTKANKSHPERRQKTQTRKTQRQKSSKTNDRGRNKKDVNSTTANPQANKSRRRVHAPSSTVNAIVPALRPVVASVAPVTLPSYTATILTTPARKSNSESKAKFRRVKTSTVAAPHDLNSYTSAGTKHMSRTSTSTLSRDSGVPPLPIEIYFKNTQNVKI